MTAKVVRIDIESDRVNEERRVYVRCGGCPLAFHLGEQAEVLITVATAAERAPREAELLGRHPGATGDGLDGRGRHAAAAAP